MLRYALIGLASLYTTSALAQDPPAEAPVAPAAPAAPAAVDDDVEDDDDADVATLRAEIDALKAVVDKQAAAIDRNRSAISKNAGKLLPKEAVKFDLHGYYRTRAQIFPNLYDFQQDEGARDARRMVHRLRLQPTLNYKDLAKLAMQFDMLDNMVWGDNASLASTALFAGDPSNTGRDGREVTEVHLKEAFIEARLPVGLLRVGRQTSQWGMGLLANAGQGFDDTFGENYGGAQFDRALFATRPIAIAQTILGKEDSEIPFIMAIAVDRLVESPLFKYYGYECTKDIQEGTPGFDARCDTDGDGWTDVSHSWTDESRTEAQRGETWWADQNDDVWEMVYVAIYRGEGIDLLGTTGDLTAGAYVINRKQRETESNVWILDAYLKAQFYGVYVEFEGLTIQGHSRAIALPDPSGGPDPLYKKPNIWGYTARLGYIQPAWKVMFESGLASGDNDVLDPDFTGRPLHPDHNVGLLLYEEVLARVTSKGWGEAGRSLWSQGGVYNSHYIFPTATWYPPIPNWDLTAGFLLVLPDKPDGRFIQCKDGEGCQQAFATAGPIGWEVDLAIKHKWHDHLLMSLETGWAHATDRLPLAAAGLNPKGNFYTFQSRIAYEF